MEIKIAIIGPAKSGKTTLVNALLGITPMDNTTTTNNIPSSSKTTTVHRYRLHSSCSSSSSSSSSIMPDNEDAVIVDMSYTSPASDLFSSWWFKNVPSSFVDTDFSTKTELVLLEYPFSKVLEESSELIRKSWKTFDCVCIVLDTTTTTCNQREIHPDDAHNLFQLVHDCHHENNKQVPLIFLCNKVDDDTDEKLMNSVAVIRHDIESIFEVGHGSISQTLDQILLNHQDNNQTSKTRIKPYYPTMEVNPLVLHLSADCAYKYRWILTLTLEQVLQLHPSILDPIGYEEMGKRQWRCLSWEDQCSFVYDLIHKPSHYQTRLESTQINSLIQIFQYFLGGDEHQQERFFQKRILDDLYQLSYENNFAIQIITLIDFQRLLEKSVEPLIDHFWTLYDNARNVATISFMESPSRKKDFLHPWKQLVEWKHICHKNSWETQLEMVNNAMKKLVQNQLQVIFQQFEAFGIKCYKCIDLYDDPWIFSMFERRWIHKTNGIVSLPYQVHPQPNQYKSHWVFDDAEHCWRAQYNNKVCKGVKDKYPDGVSMDEDDPWTLEKDSYYTKEIKSDGNTTTRSPLASELSLSERSAHQYYGSPRPNPAQDGVKSMGLTDSIRGTAEVPYCETIIQDGNCSITMQSITAMPVYECKSLEELRYEDYMVTWLILHIGSKSVDTPQDKATCINNPQTNRSIFSISSSSLNSASYPPTSDKAPKIVASFPPLSTEQTSIDSLGSPKISNSTPILGPTLAKDNQTMNNLMNASTPVKLATSLEFHTGVANETPGSTKKGLSSSTFGNKRKKKKSLPLKSAFVSNPSFCSTNSKPFGVVTSLPAFSMVQASTESQGSSKISNNTSLFEFTLAQDDQTMKNFANASAQPNHGIPSFEFRTGLTNEIGSPKKSRLPSNVRTDIKEESFKFREGFVFNPLSSRVLERSIASCHPEPNEYFCHWKYDTTLRAWRGQYNCVIHFSSQDEHPLGKKEMSWSNMSKRDWITICSSIQLLRYDKFFCEAFCEDLVKLDFILVDLSCAFQFHNCKCLHADSTQSFQDVENFGHLAWLYCTSVSSQP